MRVWRWLLTSLWIGVLLPGCSPKAVSPEGVPEASAEGPAATGEEPVLTATEGIASPLLRAIVRDHWSATMARFPEWASELGHRERDGELFDPSPEARQIFVRRRRDWLVRAASLPEGSLSPADELTRDLFVANLQHSLATEACDLPLWTISARDNALVAANRVAERARLDSPEAAVALLARYRALPAAIGGARRNLATGVARGLVTNRESLGKVLAMIEAQLAAPLDDSPLLDPAARVRVASLPRAPSTWEGPKPWAAELRQVVEQEIRPALRAYATSLQEEVLPASREGAAVGLHALPGGKECYAALIRRHTTLDRSAEALHELGLAELESIHAEFREIGQRVFGTSDLAAIFERLRTDEALRFDSAEEIEQTAEDALARARAKIPAFFGRLPEAACTVERIPAYLAPYTTVAYYQPARPDGSEPGVYYVNVHEPTTRPRHEAEVLAFHESIPGHHLQIAISQEVPGVPAFRKHGEVTAYVEGWALYTERLAEEMGLYSGDTDRLGMLSFDAWRASRLVVDTGVHQLGWSREQAEAFMVANTPLARNNIVNEVDRYVTWPGQALAYKVGQLEIRRLRAEAEAELNSAFSLPDFHDAVLESGPVPLGVLEERIRAWVRKQRPLP